MYARYVAVPDMNCRDIVLKYTSEENLNLLNIIVQASKKIDK